MKLPTFSSMSGGGAAVGGGGESVERRWRATSDLVRDDLASIRPQVRISVARQEAVEGGHFAGINAMLRDGLALVVACGCDTISYASSVRCLAPDNAFIISVPYLIIYQLFGAVLLLLGIFQIKLVLHGT